MADGAPPPDRGFWRAVAIATAFSLPAWAGIVWTIRQVLP